MASGGTCYMTDSDMSSSLKAQKLITLLRYPYPQFRHLEIRAEDGQKHRHFADYSEPGNRCPFSRKDLRIMRGTLR
ncbi:hypothetical protein E1B28_013772 [Marasmius oreades]|uniref:Uncharacterized protein n=1 Tax=Marasmius oreades TaxID=181124 RepID=A0A9P7RR28_9AGAR|nr:uncharacterized protein E1B28_013772 [Marasmius oreades]KAG7087833.1 hypothetical protein E1B28_013772 [Marasmius oreades]